MTNLLDAEEYPALELIVGYHDAGKKNSYLMNRKRIKTRAVPKSQPIFGAKPPTGCVRNCMRCRWLTS